MLVVEVLGIFFPNFAVGRGIYLRKAVVGIVLVAVVELIFFVRPGNLPGLLYRLQGHIHNRCV